MRVYCFVPYYRLQVEIAIISLLIASAFSILFCLQAEAANISLCFVLADCECFFWTDFHVLTFDHISYSYYIGCPYTLLTNPDITGSLPPFQLTGLFKETAPLILDALQLYTYGTEYVITMDGVLTVNGVVKHPLYDDEHVSVNYLVEGSWVSHSFNLNSSHAFTFVCQLSFQGI